MNPDTEEWKINFFSQNLSLREEAIYWFMGFSVDKRAKILNSLGSFIIQAHPSVSDIEHAIKVSGLKENYTPCVLIKKQTLNLQLSKIIHLPESEQRRSFVLLLTLLHFADKRRKDTFCKDGCTHWWHNL
jgi:hypothetical protein